MVLTATFAAGVCDRGADHGFAVAGDQSSVHPGYGSLKAMHLDPHAFPAINMQTPLISVLLLLRRGKKFDISFRYVGAHR